MKCAMFEVSDVAIRVLPSGLTPTPSGSTPTGTSAITLRCAEVDGCHQRIVLVGDVDRTARGMNVQLLRIWT